MRVQERGDEVRRTRTRRHDANADPAGGQRVSFGGMSRPLLVAHQDMPELSVEDRIIRREDRTSRHAEDDLDAELLERAYDRPRPR